jgi:hypothetical protein
MPAQRSSQAGVESSAGERRHWPIKLRIFSSRSSWSAAFRPGPCRYLAAASTNLTTPEGALLTGPGTMTEVAGERGELFRRSG